MSYNLPLWTYFLVHTLEYGIDVDEGISVAPGTFDQTYVKKKSQIWEIWKKIQILINVGHHDKAFVGIK